MLFVHVVCFCFICEHCYALVSYEIFRFAEVRTEATAGEEVANDCIVETQLGEVECATEKVAIEETLSDVEADVSELVPGTEKVAIVGQARQES